MKDQVHPDSDTLDEAICANQKLEAIRLLREQRGLDLAAATGALAARYRQLRIECPDRFACGDAEYWQDFHS
jgi:hypothetical protein